MYRAEVRDSSSLDNDQVSSQTVIFSINMKSLQLWRRRVRVRFVTAGVRLRLHRAKEKRSIFAHKPQSTINTTKLQLIIIGYQVKLLRVTDLKESVVNLKPAGLKVDKSLEQRSYLIKSGWMTISLIA